jgi:hypothetical protein
VPAYAISPPIRLRLRSGNRRAHELGEAEAVQRLKGLETRPSASRILDPVEVKSYSLKPQCGRGHSALVDAPIAVQS